MKQYDLETQNTLLSQQTEGGNWHHKWRQQLPMPLEDTWGWINLRSEEIVAYNRANETTAGEWQPLNGDPEQWKPGDPFTIKNCCKPNEPEWTYRFKESEKQNA